MWDLVIYPTWRNEGFSGSATLALDKELGTMQVILESLCKLTSSAHNSARLTGWDLRRGPGVLGHWR